MNGITKWQPFALACIGIFMLYFGFASDGAVDCGAEIMSPNQQCITTRIRGGSSYTSVTRNYAEQREQNHRERVFLGVAGSIFLLVGAGQIIARSRRKSEKNSDVVGVTPGRKYNSNNQHGAVRGINYWHILEIEFLEAVYGVKKRVLLPGGDIVDVAVPAGIENGQALRLSGKGEPGKEGVEAGDALIGIIVKPHPSFSRRGLDICMDVPVSEHDITSGATIEVPTLNGSAKVRIPEGTVSGQILRLRGNGIKCARSGSVGHHLVRILVTQETAHRGPADAPKNDSIEAEFRNVFFSTASADRERIISHWMKTKAVDRTEAMRLAIEDWRKDNCRHD